MVAKRMINLVDHIGRQYVVSICDGKQVDYYLCREVTKGNGNGISVEFEKADPTGTSTVATYVATIGFRDKCNCPGWQFGRKCRHVSGLKALLASGRLPGYPRETGDAGASYERSGAYQGD